MPTPHHVVDVMDADCGSHRGRGAAVPLLPQRGTGAEAWDQKWPRHFSWFPFVVDEYFQRQLERQLPPRATDVQFIQDQFDSMTAAIEFDPAASSFFLDSCRKRRS